MEFVIIRFMAIAALWVSAVSLICLAPLAQAQNTCNEFLVAREWKPGRAVGPGQCLLAERALRHRERQYFRLDLGISGTARGYTVGDGARAAYFTTEPEFVFVQTGSDADWQPATVRYEAAKGTGLALLFPARREDWNGKLWLSVHGAGRSFAKGSLRKWDERVTPDDLLRDISLYERRMLEKGYAVAKTFRSSDKENGDCVATLDSGEVHEGMNITETPQIQLDFLEIAERILAARLGAAPRRTYFYGHSAGGRNGRLMNYVPGLNRGADGKRRIDGFLVDDAGSGIWLPVMLRDGKDVLFATTESRADFAPQIDVTHQQYLAFKDEPSPEWVSGSYLLNKWQNAKILRDKGLGDRHRMYEVRGVSHSGGEYAGDGPKEGVEILPLWRVMEAVMDRLDAWVERGETPPPTRSDWAELAGRTESGALRHPAIATPEIACPLGVYFPYPTVLGTRGVGTTGFASFDGKSEEPLDGRGVFVDMNRNGIHDYRESVTEAWVRLGLLKPGERFSRQRYLNCVQAAANALSRDRLMSPETAALYVKEAGKRELPLDGGSH